MIAQPLKQLLKISSGPLGRPISYDQTRFVDLGPRGQELQQLIQSRNGFMAFEGALVVFPVEADDFDIFKWNDPTGWRNEYWHRCGNIFFFATDIFGGQYGIEGQQIVKLDPETGAWASKAASVDEWATIILADYNFETGHALAHAWQESNGPLGWQTRLVPKIPFVLGGEFTTANLYPMAIDRAMRLRGHLATQIHTLPDGARVEYRVID